MAKKINHNSRWNPLRLAILKRRRLSAGLRHAHHYVKSLAGSRSRSNAMHYDEKEMSFDEVPTLRSTSQRGSASIRLLGRILCINSRVDFDGDGDRDDMYFDYISHSSDARSDCGSVVVEREEEEEEEMMSVDERAENFIARFYEGMRSQCQYNSRA